MARRFTRVITTPAAARIPREWNRPFVSLVSDWGARDPSPAICHGVILGIAPEALIVDLSHEVDKYNVRHGALLLWCALPYLPVGSHMAVVDPGVGGGRRAIALETARGDYLIGPDNGVLLPGADRLGGVVRAHVIDNHQYRLPVISSTFHGRDLFAPATAHLAAGVPLDQIGPPIDPRGLNVSDWPRPTVRGGELETSVIYIDTFGNAKLSALGSDMPTAFGSLERGSTLSLRLLGARTRPRSVTWSSTFGDVGMGELLLYEDSYGRLCIAANQASAAEVVGLEDGSELTIALPQVSGAAKPARAGAAAADESPTVISPPPLPERPQAGE